jgi:hypothetical protein
MENIMKRPVFFTQLQVSSTAGSNDEVRRGGIRDKRGNVINRGRKATEVQRGASISTANNRIEDRSKVCSSVNQTTELSADCRSDDKRLLSLFSAPFETPEFLRRVLLKMQIIRDGYDGYDGYDAEPKGQY